MDPMGMVFLCVLLYLKIGTAPQSREKPAIAIPSSGASYELSLATTFFLFYPWRIHAAAIYGNIYHQYLSSLNWYICLYVRYYIP